jgi:MFS family permease
VVEAEHLEQANGRLYAGEIVANQFAGPPLGSILLVAGFAVPFLFDAGTFGASALLIALIVPRPRPAPAVVPERRPWREELRTGFRWLWHHELLRPMAIVLGLMNGLGSLSMSVFVLFAQEDLDTSPTEFAILTSAGAVGGVIGGWGASAISRRIGSGPSLALTLIGGAVIPVAIGLLSSWPAVAVLAAVEAFVAVLWNVITVSLRQTIIPDHLLGRVNSVYRFFAWGMMPIGAALGGIIVAVADAVGSRELALRVPFFVAGIGHLVLFVYARPRLTTAKMDAARAAASHAQPAPSTS